MNHVHLLKCFHINLRSICNVIVFCKMVHLLYVIKKNETDYFHSFVNLVGVWQDFPTKLHAHPPYLHPFSDFTFEEVV